ncbi:hypothetical protein [Streptomyces sp. NPDC059349]|uniref:hypothetical protein n=1 Tax=Streptomyces sp. NPDC059349 TaxID=3346808 RepID=UPI00367B1326
MGGDRGLEDGAEAGAAQGEVDAVQGVHGAAVAGVPTEDAAQFDGPPVVTRCLVVPLLAQAHGRP